jgi:single-strand DNA-binding protein
MGLGDLWRWTVINKVTLIGNLGHDQEMRYAQNGTPVANFSVATTEKWTDKQGVKQERTEWHRIVAWGKLGEVCGKYLVKGKQVFVEGKLQTRKWTDKDGNDRYTTEIQAREVKFLGQREGDVPVGSQSGYAPAAAGQPQATAQASQDLGYPPINDDHLPF